MSKQSTTEQLRDDIDRGRTGDKVDVSDPAAAPLGTDEEAAGTPLSGEVVQQARDYERAIGLRAHAGGGDTRGVSSAVWIYIGIILALAALLSAGVWVSYRM